MDAEDLVAMYAAQAKASMEEEANKRLEASLDPEEEERLRNLPLSDAAGTPFRAGLAGAAWHRPCCA